MKIFACLLLVVLSFAASAWAQLAVLGVTIAFAVHLAAPRAGSLWHLWRMLRWLLLFTLLMHLLLSPGRTLWGTSWLSLDGLLTGLFVCAQMLLAIVVSALLAMTSSTAQLAGAFGWYLQPLSRFGCRTGEWQQLLLLSMDFLPVIQQEMHAVSATGAGAALAGDPPPRAGRWSVWLHQLEHLLLRLVDRGDRLARRLAEQGTTADLAAELSPLRPLAGQDRLFAGMTLLAVCCYWLTG